MGKVWRNRKEEMTNRLDVRASKQRDLARLGAAWQGMAWRGKARRGFEKGIFKVIIENTMLEIVQLYVTPFVKAMRKHGHRLIYNVGESN